MLVVLPPLLVLPLLDMLLGLRRILGNTFPARKKRKKKKQ
jgi:hypothetical protein